jgi:hypothetical protein
MRDIRQLTGAGSGFILVRQSVINILKEALRDI